MKERIKEIFRRNFTAHYDADRAGKSRGDCLEAILAAIIEAMPPGQRAKMEAKIQELEAQP